MMGPMNNLTCCLCVASCHGIMQQPVLVARTASKSNGLNERPTDLEKKKAVYVGVVVKRMYILPSGNRTSDTSVDNQNNHHPPRGQDNQERCHNNNKMMLIVKKKRRQAED